MITRMLVANRGEIARRVFASCRRLGIETVAVHSDADAGLPFVREADVAVRLPGNTPAETYLRGDLMIAAAGRAGADALHPGYGFLSENADFARSVLAAGVVWVGPTPDSIQAMGSKVAAKRLMASAGVPVLTDLSTAEVTEADLPLLVKASAGGGGRGMRVVRTLDDVEPAVDRAASEAASAFGDPTVFMEPYVEHGRHIEVQVWGDHPGRSVSVLGARDCSIQRRHQKLIEESPPPGVPEETLTRMYDAARAAAEVIGYVGVGTVEFLYDPTADRFWFLEMNTRLQVEHPVTECVMGVDLVELQIQAAEDPTCPGVHRDGPHGHAVEARLYAEDPARGYQPQSGRLTRFDIPDVSAELGGLPGYGIRVDAGFEAGNEVGTHYDAMLAKVVVWAPSREQALRRLADVLRRSRIHGVRTNRDLLVGLLRHPVVTAGRMSTTFLDATGVDDLVANGADDTAVRLSAFAAAVVLAERAAAGRREQRGVPVGWRNVCSQPHLTRFVHDGPAARTPQTADESGVVEVRWHATRTGYTSPDLDARVVTIAPGRVVVEDEGGLRRTFEVFVEGDRVDVESSSGHVALTRLPRFTDPADRVATGSLLAPMPGTVVAVAVAQGEQVTAGQPVLVLEAMKMQHTVKAPHHGVVTDLPVAVGAQVASGAVLAVLESTNEGDPL